MDLLSNLAAALTAISRNGLRSLLTLVGITIGVAVVITMVAIGTGAQRSIEQQCHGCQRQL